MLRRWFLLGTIACCGIACSSEPPPPDILLITLDTTRADRLGCYGFERPVSPNLDALAGRGVLFEQAVSATPVTLPSHTTILTGLYPPAHGVRDNGAFRLPEGVPTLATRLAARGYRTGAFVAAYPLDSAFGLARGFDHYDDDTSDPTRPKFEFLFDERSASVVTQAALEWIRKQDGETPLFTWVHYFDPHAPYQPPPPFDAEYEDDPYAGEIAFMDASIGDLLEGYEEARDLEHTIVAVTADHGESLGEHGEPHHGLFIYDATQRVPLLLAGPGLPRGKRIGEMQARTVDLMPTLLDLAGLTVPGDLHGQTLMPALSAPASHPRHAYLESLSAELTYGWSRLEAVRTVAGKFIRAPKPELYDLQVDPEESENIASSGDLSRWTRTWEELRRIAAEGGRADAAVRAASPETLRRLQALGYLSASGAAQVASDPFQGPDPKDKVGLLGPFQKANQLIREGKLEEAIRFLRERVEPEDGDGVQFHLIMGQAYQSAGRPQQALPHFKRLVEQRPGDGFLWGKLGDLLIQVGQSGEAEAAYIRSNELLPGSAATLSNLAIFAAQRGDTARAKKLLEEALAADPNHLEAVANLALIVEGEGDGRRARELVDRLIVRGDEKQHRPLLITARQVAKRLAEKRGDAAAAQQHAAELQKLLR
ncbi:MAG: sulfatase-like hydrolase/transferase [Planctomycetota bacterium]